MVAFFYFSAEAESINEKCVMDGFDFQENNLEKLEAIENVETCLQKCKDKDGCKAFTYVAAEHTEHTGKAKECYLKNAAPDEAVKKTGLMSGLVSALIVCAGSANFWFNEFPLKMNQQFGEVDVGKQYVIKFDIFFEKMGDFEKEWLTIFHMTADGTDTSRLPSMFLNKNKKLYIGVDMNGVKNNVGDTDVVDEGKWYTVEMSQRLTDGKTMFTGLLNNKIFYSLVNEAPQEVKAVKVFAGDSFDTLYNVPESAKIRDLVIFQL